MNEWKASLRTADIVGAILLIVLSIVAYYITTTWIPPILPGDPGAAFFPRMSLGIIFLFSILLLAQKFIALRRAQIEKRATETESISIDVTQFFIALVFSGLLVGCMAVIGYELAAFGFLFALLGWRTGRWLWALLTSLIAVGVMYLVFVVVLTVRLPLLFLPKYLSIF
ncbi:tripartite tricarboxylate transporter TctB family protein [Pseudomonadota bacterium]